MTALEDIRTRISDATIRCGRNPSDVTILGATKGMPAVRINHLLGQGLTVIGENRVQEAEEKFPLLLPCERHLIGHLQSNKVCRALALFDCIQSVDSLRLARTISEKAKTPFRIYLEVNIGREKNKHGFQPEDSVAAYREISALPNIMVEGLMCIPPFSRDAKPFFRQLREIRDSLGPLKLSMGMSGDFDVAVEEGSDIVRIGTLLLGKRL